MCVAQVGCWAERRPTGREQQEEVTKTTEEQGSGERFGAEPCHVLEFKGGELSGK